MRMGDKGHCYACGAELRPEFPTIDEHTRRMAEDPDFQQYDNALPITYSSHAHNVDWKAAHPEHYGWDYDPRDD
jgi:hypothetical protein